MAQQLVRFLGGVLHNLLELISTGTIIVDLRMHLKENGAVRNHGTGFRIEQKFIKLCFGVREKLM